MRYDLDEAEIKPYFPLERMVEAAFDCAARLFGISFVARARHRRLPPRRRASTKCAARPAPIGLFLHDNFARPTKRSGAWMSSYRVQSRNGGDGRRAGAADHRQQQQLRQGRAGRADAAQLRRRAHALPRVRPRPARAALERHLRARLGHQRAARFRRAAVAAVRALARGAGGAEAPCPPSPDRRADPRRADRAAAPRAPLQPGLRDGALHRLGAGRHGGRTRGRRASRSTSSPSSAPSSSGSACRRRRRQPPAGRTSSTCSRARATPPATTSTCGPRCSTPTASTRSSRPAIRSTRPSRGASPASSIRRATRSSRARRTAPFAAAPPGPSRCCRQRGLLEPVRRPRRSHSPGACSRVAAARPSTHGAAETGGSARR